LRDLVIEMEVLLIFDEWLEEFCEHSGLDRWGEVD
jgi:hypothetical protein